MVIKGTSQKKSSAEIFFYPNEWVFGPRSLFIMLAAATSLRLVYVISNQRSQQFSWEMSPKLKIYWTWRPNRKTEESVSAPEAKYKLWMDRKKDYTLEFGAEQS